MRFADVIGHSRAVARLQRAASEGRVDTAFLLLGPAGIGKRTLADAFAARLLCQDPMAEDACGRCAQCIRLPAGTHPDRHVVVREEDRRDIRIEQVRELSRWLSLKPLMAGRKVAIIDEAHCLNEHGQNALLKTLEEPPRGTTLVVTASSAALLLPTVRSRCQVLRLEPLAPDAIARVLAAQSVPSERAQRLAGLAEGSAGRALALDSEEAGRARDAVLQVLPELAERTAGELSELAQELARLAPDAALSATLGWYRDTLETALVPDRLPLRHPDAAPAVRAASVRLPVVARLRQLEAVCDTLDALGKNANRVLAFETMLLWLREIERGSDAGSGKVAAWMTTI